MRLGRGLLRKHWRGRNREWFDVLDVLPNLHVRIIVQLFGDESVTRVGSE